MKSRHETQVSCRKHFKPVKKDRQAFLLACLKVAITYSSDFPNKTITIGVIRFNFRDCFYFWSDIGKKKASISACLSEGGDYLLFRFPK